MSACTEKKNTFVWHLRLKSNIYHWFTTHLANKSHHCLACSKTPYYSDANELQRVWCMELDAVGNTSLHCSCGSTPRRDAHYSLWMARETRNYGGLRRKSPEATASVPWVMMCVSEGRCWCVGAAGFPTVMSERDGILHKKRNKTE